MDGLELFLKSSSYYDRLDWSVIDLNRLERQVREEMQDEYDRETFLERLAYRAGSIANENMEYDKLASLILMNLHDEKTKSSLVETIRSLQENTDVMKRSRPILSDEFVRFIEDNADTIESIFLENTEKCFLPTLFGWRTLVRSYLLRSNGQIRERLPHMLMRIALFIHKDDWSRTLQCYRDLLDGKYTHATPTLFHAGTRRSQMASCFMSDAAVWTIRGIKRIDEIKVGDKVFTHNGNISSVLQVHRNALDSRQLYRLYAGNGRYIATATGDHEFMIVNEKTEKMEWKRLDRLTRDDYLMESWLNKPINEDPPGEPVFLFQFPRIVGLILAHLCNDEKKMNYMDFDIYKNIDMYNESVQEMKKIGYKCSMQANCIHLNEKELLSTLYRLRKYIIETVMKNRIWEFIEGWQDVSTEDSIVFQDVQEAEMMCIAMNIASADDHYVVRPDGDGYIIEIDAEIGCCMPIKKSRIMLDGRPFIRFDRRKRVDNSKTTEVWTLGIDGDHSYSVNGIVAKNCFLMGTEDSVNGIFKTISDAAQISKWAGGIGIHLSNIRANKSYIYGTNGHSNGILPMLKVYNNVSRYIDQCFAPDVLVLSKTGMKPIGSIQKGDFVMNHLGQFQAVHRVLEYENNDDILYINHAGVTPEHNILNQDMEYRMLSEMSADDHVMYPVVDMMPAIDNEITHERLHFLARYLTMWNKTVCIDGWRAWTFTSVEDQRSVDAVCSKDFLLSEYKMMDCMVRIVNGRLEEWITKHMSRICFISKEKQDAFLDMVSGISNPEIEFIRRLRGEETDNYIQMPVHSFSVEKRFYQGKVYDLEMEGHKNYVSQIGIVHNGGGKRNGAFAMYIEPWHADIYDFINAKRNIGAEEERARDLFYGLWIPDLFMERVENDQMWSLFCPSTAPYLSDRIGPVFKDLYEQYESEKRYIRQVRARDLWAEILRSQIETGTPYMLYKDACNYKSNQKNLGIIKSSNLCVSYETRIMTRNGISAIGKLKDEWVDIWNGQDYRRVQVRQTGTNRALWRISVSNGAVLECTPEHQFYVIRDEKTVKIAASELRVDDLIAPYRLPDYPAYIPPKIELSIRWIIQKGIIFNDSLFVYSEDKDSLYELMFHLEWCGIRGNITDGNHQYPYKLVIDKTRFWNIQKKINYLIDHQQMVDDASELINDLRIANIDTTEHFGDTFCFTEPVSGKGWFSGICTGQCTEIIEYSDDKEYACCNLASIALPRFLKKRRPIDKKWIVYTRTDCPFCRLLELETASMTIEKRNVEEYQEIWTRLRDQHNITTVPAVFCNDKYIGGFVDVWKTHLRPEFDFDELYRITYALTENLNKVIDLNVYPLSETEKSNHKHRPIGIGIQGLADVFGAMRMAFDEEEAKSLNKDIFETIYYAALCASNDLALKDGPYSTFRGSPLSMGQFHFDLTCPAAVSKKKENIVSDRYDWDVLRSKIIRYGVRNSLLIAPMPTASTSQILGNTECFEPWTSNIFTRRTNAGEFYICNHLLRRDLQAIGLWNEDMMDRLIATQGSIASFPVPKYLKDIYRTVWEISQRSLIDMAIDRQYFIDQSQSLNIFVSEPSLDLLTKIHFYGWKNGLKTGCYYIRARAPVSSINYTISNECTACSA